MTNNNSLHGIMETDRVELSLRYNGFPQSSTTFIPTQSTCSRPAIYSSVLHVVHNTIQQTVAISPDVASVMYVAPASVSISWLTKPQDPRQYVPPSGQSFTTLNEMQSKYKNVWLQDVGDKRVWGIHTEPRVSTPNQSGSTERTLMQSRPSLQLESAQCCCRHRKGTSCGISSLS